MHSFLRFLRAAVVFMDPCDPMGPWVTERSGAPEALSRCPPRVHSKWVCSVSRTTLVAGDYGDSGAACGCGSRTEQGLRVQPASPV